MEKLRRCIIWYEKDEILSFTEGYSKNIVEAIDAFLKEGHEPGEIVSAYIPKEDMN